MPSRALPPHLARFVVDQDWASYTPRDHAVWRHIVGRLKRHLEHRAHPVYLKGLDATGIELEQIPRLEAMNARLERMGWQAVAVRGFLPPAVFTELQARKVLAIAADIRDHTHLGYTPAPDIVHESAGHSPILADPAYAAYVQAAGEVGFKAISSAEDRTVFEAIRHLSVVKEDPHATPDDVAHAEARLDAAAASIRYVSESTRASRLYWWTAEYGLVGTLTAPKLYGAGLLSSMGEAEHCLTDAVKKVPLTVACADQTYDITRMQPQLFVARDFAQLNEVLEEFKRGMAWQRGGDYGLDEALKSQSVNHLVLDEAGTRIELTGTVQRVHRFGPPTGPNLTTAIVEIAGPVMFTGNRPKRGCAVVLIGEATLPTQGRFSVKLASGVEATGFVVEGHEVISLEVKHAGQRIAVPTWGHLVIARGVPSIAGGPADPQRWDDAFGSLDSFATGEAEAMARKRKAEALPKELADAYTEVNVMHRIGRVDAARIVELKKRWPDEPLLLEEIDLLRV